MNNERRERGIALSTGRRLVSYLLKCVVVVSAAVGVILSAMASASTFMGGGRVFMYFTIQSNIAIGLICLIGGLLLAAGRKPGNGWHVIKFMGTVSITLTGVVFCFVLAPTLGRYAWNAQNILTHVVVPIAAIADFFVAGICGDLKWSDALYGTLPPLAYAVYAGIGYAAGWEFSPGRNYPYFFLNWGSPAGAFGFSRELPFMGCGWWLVGLFILVYLVGLAYVSALNAMKRRAMRRL